MTCVPLNVPFDELLVLELAITADAIDSETMKELEAVIRNGDVEGFFIHLQESYIKFLHNFGKLALNKYEAEEKMGNVSDPKCLLDLLTANQEAFVVLVVINSIEGWESRKGRPLDRKHCSSRWTGVTTSNDYDDDDESTSTNSADKNKRARKTYKSGYSLEGLQFYEKAVKFFKDVRAHPMAVNEGCYYNMVLMHYINEKQNGSKKRKRRVEQTEEEIIAADYGDWEEPNDGWAKQASVPI